MMALTDTRAGYGWISIALHWLVAVLVIALFLIGEQFEDLGREAGASLRALHVSIGMIAVVTVLARIAWRFTQGNPKKAEDPRLILLLSILVQWGLILATLALVITGPLSIWTTGQPIDVFGMVQLASPLERNRELHEAMEEIHEVASSVLLPLVALHVLGALKHAVLDRDGIFMRMLRPAREG
ncbi:cytochrome b [Breoghania sp. L-A4]|uniref:cytochrome b n=1 Tax=Breoghania sp. L-A4 TaxID=2304600 RepID=UPI000E35CBB0|nr:cytochrome b [Breoghania sp. L-A4]AXS41325.1 cytochrome b [Breoghania sp. L-A4]